MNRKEAIAILEKELAELRLKPYSELRELFNSEPITKEIYVSDETTYQIEINVFWDDKPDGNIRVAGSIDDGGWRAYLPLGASFIKTPNNTFIGE